MLVNIPFVEALEQIPGYIKFMKDLNTKKREVSYEPIHNVHHCSILATRSLLKKKKDPGSFAIPCTIRSFNFGYSLCDLGVSINLMLFVVFKKLGLGAPKPTTMRLVMVDGTVKKPVYCEVDLQVPIILGRPFLSTGRTLINSELRFLYDVDTVTLLNNGFDVVVLVEERLGVKALAVVIMNFDSDGIEEYKEIVSTLHGKGSYDFAPKNLDLDLKNRTTPLAWPFIEEPPVLELKALLSHLRYAFLRANNTLTVIIIDETEVVKKEIIRWLDVGMVYPIGDSNWTSNVADIRYEVMKIKKMVIEIYKRPVVVEPVLETMIHTVHVPNIWAIPLDAPVEDTEE
ncbi:uncharacterized protein LOC124885790 [Capsicum annuum]|uniref:uncharacterized protein LOC124885790 n=1 Tax=Capsicum annuum TaxID=4072 RepID=UPI001FB0FD3B|nr:uncharacterized protein LOC124885790 [Capsicum annuum]